MSAGNGNSGSYDKRLGQVEREVSRLDATLGGVQRDVTDLKGSNSQILSGIQELRTRELTRPPPTNWRAAVATALSIAGGLGLLAGFSWWFTSVSPAVVNLEKRMTRIDDPEVGKMPRTERRLDELERLTWPAKVTRN